VPNRHGKFQIMTTNTTPITVYPVHITGPDLNAYAGMGMYISAPGADLTVYAAPTSHMVKGAVYTVTGVIVNTNTHVTFQNVTYAGSATGQPAVATFNTTGWISP
jgi:hypothetical protein